MPTSAHHPGESLRRQRHHLRCRRSSREASGKAHRRKDIYVLLVPQWTLQTTPHLTSSTCAIVPRRAALWHLCLRNATWTGGVVTGIYRPPGIPAWMVQVARNVTMEAWGFLSPGQYLIHDRDGKYCPAFQHIIDGAGVKRVPLPPRSPNLNAYAERWVRSIKEECLSRMILFGEASLRHAL